MENGRNKFKFIFDCLKSFVCVSTCCTGNAEKKIEGKLNMSNKSDSEVVNQLMMVHDPFADTTSQPKIPDGKITTSLGLSAANVDELTSAEGVSTVHMLLYAGCNSCLAVTGVTAHNDVNRNFHVMGLSGQPVADWEDAATFVGDVVNGTKMGAVQATGTQHALWRVVSCGLQLKLLNAAEEDDGWWEAIRLNRDTDLSDFGLTTSQSVAGRTGIQTNGTLAPYRLIDGSGGGDITTRTIYDDPSYSTGLLRDLDKVQFELHGRLDFHDFKVRKRSVYFDEATDLNFGAVQDSLGFTTGRDESYDLINEWIDQSYDMIYVRLHTRIGGVNGAGGSRLHTHVVSNQEVYFEDGTTENRFQTPSVGIGQNSVSLHMQGRRASHHAAQLITS